MRFALSPNRVGRLAPGFDPLPKFITVRFGIIHQAYFIAKAPQKRGPAPRIPF